MEAVEGKSRELGARILWLNVFESNQVAQKLYLARGFEVATIHMRKLLKTHSAD